jgi:hypothetical protein
MQITVPASINFVVNADGIMTGPTDLRIENHSPFGTCVSSVQTKAEGGFTFVKDVAASDVDNAVSLTFGTDGESLDAVDCLTKRPVGNQDAWKMGSEGETSVIPLSTEGKVSRVSTDITRQAKFGEIRWYVKVGNV